jgi:hypothetical protein
MRIIGKGSNTTGSTFIVEMSYPEVYRLCGNQYPKEGVEVDIVKITDVVRAVTTGREMLAHHAKSMAPHVDAIIGAAKSIADAVDPAIMLSLQSEEGG